MTEAGWYDDPSGTGRRRYFDGAAWTDRLSDPVPPESQRDTVTGRRAPWWAVIIALVAGLGGGFAAGTSTGDDEPSRTRSPADAERTETTRRTTTTKPQAYQPVPADFTLTVITTEKKCFGSAGCSLQYDIELNYLGIPDLDVTDSWTVTYEVTGGEDGPQIGSLELDGDGTYRVRQGQRISTATESAVLTGAVTLVRAA